MFDFFRNNMKFLMGLLMLLIIPSFVLFGIEGYSSFRESGDVVARVGKTTITRQEWDAAHLSQVDRQVQSLPGVDRGLLESEPFRLATLEDLINQRVLALAAADGHYIATELRTAQELIKDPEIAALRRPDGGLDLERYQSYLQSRGVTQDAFEASIRGELSRQQVVQGVVNSGFFTPKLTELALNAWHERREVQIAHFKPADFVSTVQVSDADLRDYYDRNPAQFQSPEQVDVEYLVLDMDGVSRRIQVPEADLRAYYDQNVANQSQRERRRASHILLTVDSSASAEDKAKVRDQAQAIQAEVKANPSRFAELARTRSQDPGSAAKGGDLDFFQRGDMVKPFADAVFALQKGQISDVVETEFGFHVIQLTDVRAEPPEPFEQARPRLEQELRAQLASRQFAQAAEDFTNTVYEQSDALQPAAEKLGLTVRQVKAVERAGPGPGSEHAVLANPKVLEAMFSRESVQEKRNSSAIDIGGSRLVSVRVLAHRPAATKPFAEVSASVREQLIQSRAVEAAKAAGLDKLAVWQKDATGAALQAPVVVSRTVSAGLPGPVLRAALAAPAGPSTVGWAQADLGREGFVVVRVNRVLERAPAQPGQQASEAQQLTQLWLSAEARAYLQTLRQRYEAKVLYQKKEL